ncbi:MAG: CoxG family protein [bacterium]
MEFKGTFEINAPQQVVFSHITDIKWVSACLPTLSELKIKSKEDFEATFKVDVTEAAKKLHIEYLSQVTVKMAFKFLSMSVEKVVLEGSGRVVGGSLKIRIEFPIEGLDGKTRIPWTAHVDAGLLLKFFGEKLITDTSNEIVDGIVKCISEKLGKETQSN